MIKIKCDKKTNEIEMAGTPQELQLVCRSILHLTQTNETQITISAAIDFDPAPYSNCLNSITICKSEDLIKVTIAIDRLEIHGSPKNLEVFADWFNCEDDTAHYHCHFEYYPGNDLIHPDSLPLVISMRS
jgi:hypothetical protein